VSGIASDGFVFDLLTALSAVIKIKDIHIMKIDKIKEKLNVTKKKMKQKDKMKILCVIRHQNKRHIVNHQVILNYLTSLFNINNVFFELL